MTYTRIGWHSDHQSRPTSDIWPGVAVTFHLDATSPANGFLRVVPGSHRGTDEGMPVGFEKVGGEVGVYCDRGDVLLHHSDLWHAAARATEDPPAGIRRHIRGAYLGGRRLAPDEDLEPFNKNAAR
jgi:ectoine hydroxylase-related dioxygenase (phytanoyl-CoA dioxygenase family)